MGRGASPQCASLHSQLQQEGQGQVLVLQGDAARPLGARRPVNIPEITAVGQEHSQGRASGELATTTPGCSRLSQGDTYPSHVELVSETCYEISSETVKCTMNCRDTSRMKAPRQVLSGDYRVQVPQHNVPCVTTHITSRTAFTAPSSVRTGKVLE